MPINTPGLPPPVDLTFTLLRLGATPLNLTPIAGSLRITTLAVGGYGSCSFSLEGDLGYWKHEAPPLSKLYVTYGSKSIYEGQIEDHGLSLAAGQMVVNVTAFGFARRFDETKMPRIYSKRDMNWVDMVLTANHPGAWTTQFGRFDEADPTINGLVFVGTGAVSTDSNESRRAAWWPPAGVEVRKIIWSGSLAGVSTYHLEVGSFALEGGYTKDEEVTSATTNHQTVLSTSGGVAVGVETNSGSSFTPAGSDQGKFFDVRVLCTELDEDSGSGSAAGFYGGSLLRDLVMLIPDLTLGVIEDGDDFTVPQASQDERRELRALLTEITSYYTREWGVWENAAFHWRTPDFDEVQWVLLLSDLRRMDLQWSIEGVAKDIYLSYDDAGRSQWFGNTQKGEAQVTSDDRRNPYVRTGIRKDLVASPGFPMTANSAEQLATRFGDDLGSFPRVNGSITVPAHSYVRHATRGTIPAILIRAGENITIADLPKSDPLFPGRDGETMFHIVSTSYSEPDDQMEIELQGFSTRTDVLLARLAAVTRVLTG